MFSPGRELSIASSFVKQYYTLLNKAPCFIHNFYSQDSTFIHGTIEMANEHHPGPVIGRDKIKMKMEELNLNDCRAKIKQIDCLETLAGGLVIQVIGELSNNGRPMRRFLQTFVLAPSPDENRQEGDISSRPKQAGAGGAARGGTGGVAGINANPNETNHNQKFFVLNSIFRYQDGGQEGEFEDEVAGVHANAPADRPIISANDDDKVELVTKQDQTVTASNGPVTGAELTQNIKQQQQPPPPQQQQQQRRQQTENVVRNVDASMERLDLEDGVKLNRQGTQESELKRDGSVGHSKVVSNGTGAVDKKIETSEKAVENTSKNTNANSQGANTISTNTVAASQSAPVVRPQPSNEPKTWANMVRNYQPPATATQLNVNKTLPSQAQGEQQPQQPQNLNQPSAASTNQQSSQSQQQQNQQSLNSNNSTNNNNNNSNNSNNNNPRRHRMMRKSSNKSTGRTIKSRPPRPPTAGKPVA